MKPIQLPPTVDVETLKQAPVDVLVDIIVRQQETIGILVEEIERLKGLLHSDSTTSSKPPSSDIYKRSEKKPSIPPSSDVPKERNDGKQSKRKPGGQPGHPGRTRKGFGRVDRYESVYPERCECCGAIEFENPWIGVRRQTVAHLVERPIEVVEYKQHYGQCTECGTIVYGKLPSDVVGEQSLGASLQSLLAWLGNYGHLSYAKQQELLVELGQIEVGTGTLQATNARTATRVAPYIEQLGIWVKQLSHVQVDETPWLVKGVKEWLWVVCGVGFCWFHAGDTRSRAELETVLGQSFSGVLSSDDYSVYNGYPVEAQQKCLAHLRRHFKKVEKLKYGNNARLAGAFLELIDEAFDQHRQWRETQNYEAYQAWATRFKEKLKQALARWLPGVGYAAGLLLRSLRDKWAQWWYFLDHPEVPPDNNRAERSLRLAVTKRKVCGGSRSMTGFAQTADILTVIQTCRAQGRSALTFFREALQFSSNMGDVQPSLSLIPESVT